MLCIWAAAENRVDNSVWAFALVSFCLVGEGFYAIFVRAGDEPKWLEGYKIVLKSCGFDRFSPAIAVYLLATVIILIPSPILQTSFSFRHLQFGCSNRHCAS